MASLAQMESRAQALIKNPSQAGVTELKSYISQLQQALTQIQAEKNKLQADVESVNKTKHAAHLQDEGDKMMQMLANAKNKLAVVNSNLRSEQEQLSRDIDNHRRILGRNHRSFKEFSEKIEDKMELLATRDRMLQLSQERNVYKKKIIYVLFSVIFALLVCMLAVYAKYKK